MNVNVIEMVNARRIVLGPEDTYRGVRPLRYPWTDSILRTMTNNTWHPDVVDLTADSREKETLPEGYRKCYDKTLAFLSNLDAIQLDNLSSNLSEHITCHEIKRVLNRQIWEEEIHVMSYSQMVEATCHNPIEIYNMHAVNPILHEKNTFIMEQARRVKSEGFTLRNMALAIDTNIILEGVYFFTGFLNMYAIGRASKKMRGSVDMIKYIQRDELTHLDFFQHLYRAFRRENPHVYTKDLEEERVELYKAGCNVEKAWGIHTIEDGVLGLTDSIVSGFVESIVDRRASSVDLPIIYNTKNSVPWFDDYSSLESGNTNNFERRNKDYQATPLEW